MDLDCFLLNYLTEVFANTLESWRAHFEIPQHAQIWPFEEYFCYFLRNLSESCSRRTSAWCTKKNNTVRFWEVFVKMCDFIAGGAQHLIGISIHNNVSCSQANDIFNNNTAKTMSDKNERARALLSS